jgi:hypothetical protein
MTTNSQTQFLTLLRAGLWGGRPNADGFPASQTDWQEIFLLAGRQSVEGLVYDGIAALPANVQPDAGLLRQWYMRVVMIEQGNMLLDSVLSELYTLYRDAGLRPVLLKGQGVARCYLNPLRRQGGDIDLYVGWRDFRKANEIALAAARAASENKGNKEGGGGRDARLKISPKHGQLQYRGVTVENHRIVSALRDRRSRRWFSGMVAAHLDSGEPNRRLHIGGCEIPLPPAEFDAVFLLLHLFQHFVLEGVGLRQVCDWARLLHVYRHELDHDRLRRDIAALGLERAWAVFGHIAVADLGLPRDEFPFFDERAEAPARQTLAMIFKEGNFGFFNGRRSTRPGGYLSGKFHSFRWMMRRFRKLQPIFPDVMRKLRRQFVWGGLKRLLTLQRPE